jgi:hypothetical protein
VLVGCTSTREAPAPTQPPLAPEPVAIVAALPDASIDAPPAVPEEVASAPRWIYRELHTGGVQHESSLSTFVLQWHEAQAVLTEERRVGPSRPGARRIERWSAPELTQYVGAVTFSSDGKRASFTFTRRGDSWPLDCVRGTVRAASAAAVRTPRPSRRGEEECGDPGRWVPGATTQVAALRCALDQDDPDREEGYAFAPAPGLELLYVNDDCDMQGGGYRRISADGSIGNVRR